MSEKKRLGIFGWIIGFTTVIFNFLLLLSYTSLFVHPEKIWFVHFLGMAYPYLLIANATLFIYWLIRWKRFALYTLIVMAIGYGLIPRYYGFNKDSEANENGIGILSYNVHVFGRWQKGADENIKIKKRQEIADYVSAQQAQIVCFQEFYTKKQGNLNNEKALKQNLQLKHLFKVPYLNDKQGYYILTYSKYPILHSGTISIKKHKKNFCIYTDLEIDKRTIIRVYNIHLKSLNIQSEEYLFSGEFDLRNEESADKVASGAKNVVSKMKEAFKIRAIQVDTLRKHIASSPYPVVIAGDFNDTPVSYAYQRLQKGNTDAFIQSGQKFSQTYVGKFPSFRIDYILHSEDISSDSYQRGEVELSDHHPIFCKLYLKEN